MRIRGIQLLVTAFRDLHSLPGIDSWPAEKKLKDREVSETSGEGGFRSLLFQRVILPHLPLEESLRTRTTGASQCTGHGHHRKSLWVLPAPKALAVA